MPTAIPVNAAARCLIASPDEAPLGPALSGDLAPEELIRADRER
jgi:hypothetical protein